MSRAPTPVDRRIAIALVLVTFVVLWATERPVGFVRDESVYFAAAEQFSRWWALLFHRPASALSDAVITQAFDFNHEHPMLMKSLFGWSHALFHQTLGWVRPGGGVPAPGLRRGGAHPRDPPRVGVGALGPAGRALRRALLLRRAPPLLPRAPRCFDMPVAAMWLLVVYLFWRAEEDLRFAPWTGVAFGLALATKHNAFFLPVVLTPFGVLAAWRVAGEEGRERRSSGWAGRRWRSCGYLALLLVVQGRRRARAVVAAPAHPQTFGVVALVASLAALALQLRRRDAGGVRPARAAGRDGAHRPRRLLGALALALVPPGGPAGLVLRLPRHPRPLRLDLLRRTCCGPLRSRWPTSSSSPR